MDRPPEDLGQLASLREDYQLGGLDESDLSEEPLSMFDKWLHDALEGGVYDPNAMVLSTVSAEGLPSSRAVLLKGLSESGFRFFTNLESRKANELTENSACALNFGWFVLQRQVRVEGRVVVVPRAETEAYFATRPRSSQLGAWASVEPVAQSGVVTGRDALQSAYEAALARFEGRVVPCPPSWGGYDVVPERVEFWQGRSGRMHDRLVYQRDGEEWRVSRLAP